MSAGSQTPERSRGPWPVLDVVERRVLGVLSEKQKTTPDAYPMSLNGLVAGCNQKSNREPLLTLDEDEVEEALERLLRRELVERAPSSGRVERWRHLLYVSWEVEKVELAVLTELLLRGPQTEGELRTRASRMDPIEDLDALRNLLRTLGARNLVVYLTPEERRGAVVTHGFHDPRELERERERHSSAVAPARPSPSPGVAPPASPTAPAAPAVDGRMQALESALARARDEVASLRQQVEDLSGEVADLRQGLRDLKEALGV